ncbi:efflux family protein [Vibrio ichthyoenteri ATCC 700023]|uniref:Efflux family protein n=1 Tax=Vibrio ichthyoenteri ATCC 700023 TaxID=870968 RepID=F9S174_9VIBR|nr:LysE family translocator [Vibrio ichthyoenteri]EGU42117.1 efflux family protein [Vibrio ichthyoenteri ATCC 700023]
MNSLIFAMIVFAFVGSTTPGPVNLLATSTAINHGKRAAAKFVIGASVAYAMVVFLTGGMMQTVATLIPKLSTIMQLTGSLFILYLAYKIYTAPVTSIESSNAKKSGFWTGSLTQILNPKAWLVAMSGVSLYVIGQENEHLSLLVFTAVSLILCLIGVGIWAVVGRLLAKYLNNAQRYVLFNRVMAVLLAVSVGAIWI